MSELTQNTRTRTAMVDGTEMDADKAAAIHEVREIFVQLQKSLKQINLYRHLVDRYGEYIEPVHTRMADFLERKGMLDLKLEAMSFKYKGVIVFEDDSRENNLIYPFWAAGVRLFMFKPGLSPDELLKFLMLTLGDPNERQKKKEDIVTQLWKSEFEYIEYIVVEAFKVLPDEDIEDVEIEVDKLVAYLYRQLQSNSEDYLRFARISLDDLDLELNNVDQIRGAVVQGITATAADKHRVRTSIESEQERVLPKLVTVLFQLLELDTVEENFEDVAEAFIQLLDALLLQEHFTAIHQIRKRFEVSSKKPKLSAASRDLVQRCGDRFNQRMAESQRLQTIAQILNQGVVKDAEGVRAYLYALGVDALLPLVEMLESLELMPNRRLVCDVLADLGKDQVQLFTARLTHPSSNLVKDMLYVIDKINPPEKFAIFSHVLKHPNAILRLETLALIGRNNDDECFNLIADVLLHHEDPQLRSQAARQLPNFAAEKAGPLLLQAASNERLDRMEEPEKKAMFVAMGQTPHPDTQAFLFKILDTKAGLFSRRKTDDLKMLAIIGLEGNPSVPALKKLAEVAQDEKRHSQEVVEAARAAAVQMQARIMGAA